MDEDLEMSPQDTDYVPDADPEVDDLLDVLDADETEAEGVEAEPEAALEPEPEPTRYQPPVASSNRLERLQAALDPEIFADLVGWVQETVQSASQSIALSSVQIAQAQQAMPALMKVHGAAIQGYVSELPAEAQRSPNAIPAAMARLVYEQMTASGDPAATITALAKLAGSTAGKAPKPVVPPTQRVPSGSASGSTGRGPSPMDREIKALVDEFGMTRAEARAELERGR